MPALAQSVGCGGRAERVSANTAEWLRGCSGRRRRNTRFTTSLENERGLWKRFLFAGAEQQYDYRLQYHVGDGYWCNLPGIQWHELYWSSCIKRLLLISTERTCFRFGLGEPEYHRGTAVVCYYYSGDSY